MTRSLTWKLTLAFLLVALTVALLVGFFIRLTSAEQLGRLLLDQQRSGLQSSLADYYAANGSWRGVNEFVRDALERPFARPTPAGGFGAGNGGGPPDVWRERRLSFGLADAGGRVVIPLAGRYPAGAIASASDLAAGDDIIVNGQLAGVILSPALPPSFSQEERAYLARTNVALGLAAAVAVVVAMLVGALLARTLTRPLRALTQATERMAGGALEQEVAVGSADELGQLAAAFNQMSRALAEANQARRQMSADVAHELRTPLTVISGYVESMRDGVLAPTPARLAVVYGEIEHLQHVVGDLRTLSQADTGELKLNRQPVAIAELLGQAQAAFELHASQKGVSIEVQLAPDLPEIMADEFRLSQVLSNLISNAIRHTPARGRVTLAGSPSAGGVSLSVHDTGTGIAPEDLPRIFDRFYRADTARSDEGGESGLGLAIAQALVEAHGGRIHVESVAGQQTTFHVHLPLG